jgi:opacity protein-like surface antigen
MLEEAIRDSVEGDSTMLRSRHREGRSMRTQRWFLAYAVMFGIGLAVPPLARAQGQPWDFAVSGFAGGAIPFTLDVSVTEPTTATDLRGTGVELSTSVSFGGKLSAWWTGFRRYIGLDVGSELDVTQFYPDLKQQDVSIHGTLEGRPFVGTLTLEKIDLSATIVAANLMVRRPIGVTAGLPHGRWHLYAGIGGGVEIAHAKLRGGTTDTDTAGVFQTLAGLKVFLTRPVALFAEYKYTYADHDFTFNGNQGGVTLSINHVVGGVAVHF